MLSNYSMIQYVGSDMHECVYKIKNNIDGNFYMLKIFFDDKIGKKSKRINHILQKKKSLFIGTSLLDGIDYINDFYKTLYRAMSFEDLSTDSSLERELYYSTGNFNKNIFVKTCPTVLLPLLQQKKVIVKTDGNGFSTWDDIENERVPTGISEIRFGLVKTYFEIYDFYDLSLEKEIEKMSFKHLLSIVVLVLRGIQFAQNNFNMGFHDVTIPNIMMVKNTEYKVIIFETESGIYKVYHPEYIPKIIDIT